MAYTPSTLAVPSYSYDDLQAILDSDLDCFPTTLYSLTALTSPLTQAEFTANFGAAVNTIGNSIQVAIPGLSTNFITANTVECPFLLMGIRVIFVTPNTAFGIAGASAVPGSASSPIPVPTFDGTFPEATSLQPAYFEYGQNVQRAIQSWLEANFFTLQLGCKFNVVETSLARVGCVMSDAEFCGYGDQLSGAMLRIRQANDRLDVIGGRTDRFIPVNTLSSGDTPVGAGSPMARAAFGGPCDTGDDNWYAVRGGMGILLTNDTTIQARIQQDAGAALYQQSLAEELLDHPGPILAASGFTDETAGGLKASSMEFKLGNLRVGIEFKGCELTPRACFDWALRYGKSYEALYTNSGYFMNMAAPMLAKLGFRGLGDAFKAAPTSHAVTQMLGKAHLLPEHRIED